MHQRTRRLSAATATLLPLAALCVAAPASAEPPEPAPPRPVSAGPVPESELVPGVPLPAVADWMRGTPDEGQYAPRPRPGTSAPAAPTDTAPRADTAAPSDRAARPGVRPADGEDPQRTTPGEEFATPRGTVEYVPPAEAMRDAPAKPPTKPGAKPDAKPAAPEPACSTSTGPYQRQVEGYLKLPVDGKQSPSDCAAIQTFQREAGIYPDSGFAGPVTWKVLTLRWARANPGKLTGCPETTGRIACLDLNRQLMWVKDGGTFVYKPVAIRSGKPGLETRTGWHTVYNRVRHEHSYLYDSPMPFAQYFDGGQAIHGVYDDLYTTTGSHGCVNLTYKDAKRLWGVLKQGDDVYVWGAKPTS